MAEVLTAPVIGRAFRKVRNAMNGPTLETRLNTAVAEVRRLEGERQRINTELEQKTDTSRFDEAVKKAEARFQETKSFEDERALILEQLIAIEASKRVAPMAFARISGFLVGMDFAEFSRQYPAWRHALKLACQLKLENAKEKLAEVEAELTPELRAQGFDDEQISGDIRIKRARGEVERWGGAPERCENEGNGEHLWGSLVGRFCREQ